MPGSKVRLLHTCSIFTPWQFKIPSSIGCSAIEDKGALVT
jgi:hypothetical protein